MYGELRWLTGLKGVCFGPDGPRFDPYHERIDRRVFNSSQIELQAPCYREHFKLSVLDVVTASVRAFFSSRRPALSHHKAQGLKYASTE
ncbi:hypothetical protein EVAR_79629_1 [Eumeta japonica]|uniref:Uncharacterized protein n=1 Tax=Eumeta variegata TaxID=151549 RepID=A0A4C1UFN2_EUMVA|nr:hypothetical protein EVAR_79629_1 [Eumeta japonica]